MENANDCYYELGVAYYQGEGVEVDYKMATEMLRKQAAKEYSSNQADADLLLGALYQEGGHGIEQDYAAAAKWYKAAIDLPTIRGINESAKTLARKWLGDLYLEGHGVLQDYSEALKR